MLFTKIDARLHAAAWCCVIPPIEVRRGMMMKPPPNPTIDPRADAAKPMHKPATVCRTLDTGGFCTTC